MSASKVYSGGLAEHYDDSGGVDIGSQFPAGQEIRVAKFLLGSYLVIRFRRINNEQKRDNQTSN